jgi:hypothetical protein
VAHLQHSRDLGHRHAAFVGGSDRLVSVGPQLVGFLLKRLFAPRVLLGECR